MLATDLHLLSSLSAIAIAAALLFNLALQTKRSRVEGLFSAGLLVWGLVGVFSDNAALSASVMTLTICFYFLHIHRQIRAENSFIRPLTLGTPILVIVNLVLIWVVAGGQNIAFILLMVYAAAAFWSIMSSRDDRAPRLRGAGLLMIIACAAPLFADWPAPLLTAIAAGWIGWITARRQVDVPMHDAHEELRIANRDLRQAVNEVANLRTQQAALNQELQAASQYRSDFLDKLGHKLRTPLNSISGYTELLQSGLYGELNEKQLDRLGKIQRNGENLLELISNMLDLNTINAGRLELNRTTLALNEVIEQVVTTMEARRNEKSLALKMILAPELPMIFGDEARICQVITQMVDNALKFTLEGEVTIQSQNVHVEKGVSAQFPLPLIGWLSDGDWVLIAVSDSGIGIAPEDQAKIFDEFYQISDARTEAYFGTGLGLSIAKMLAELHEGVLWVKSAADHGSTFYLALRAQRKESGANSAAEKSS